VKTVKFIAQERNF